MRKLIKYLPKFIRWVIATLIVMKEGEYGGTLYDFLSAQTNQGDMSLVHKWEDDASFEQAKAIITNAAQSGRDFVYVGAVKTGKSRGYMIVHSSKHTMWICGFIPGIYEPLDAYRDAILKAKNVALSLGYHPRGVN